MDTGSSGQSSWVQIQRSGFDSRRYNIFWEVVGLERGPLSPVNTIEELLGRISNGPGLEIQEYGRRDPSRWPRGTLSPWKLVLTSLTGGGHSVSIVHWKAQATEFFFYKFSALGSCVRLSMYGRVKGQFGCRWTHSPHNITGWCCMLVYAVGGIETYYMELVAFGLRNILMWLRYKTCDVLHFAGPAGRRQNRPCNVHVSISDLLCFQSWAVTLPLKGLLLTSSPVWQMHAGYCGM
jgi:hypothetical protein